MMVVLTRRWSRTLLARSLFSKRKPRGRERIIRR